MANILWTPWRSHNELLAVRSQLYPTPGGKEPDERAKACSIIAVWRVRRKLPHAVESTWLLTETVLADEEMGLNGLNSVSIRMCYNTTLSRFVTGLVDTEQDGAVKSSMYEKAKQIGLPAYFIDLRHDAIHGDLPSLTIFREATKEALKWLWNDYWHHLDTKIRKPLQNDGSGTAKEQARKILRDYQPAAPTTAPTSQAHASDPALEPNRTAVRLCEVFQSEKAALAELVDVLVDEDMLIPCSRTRDDSMDGIISMWGGLMKQLSFHHKRFLQLLTQKLFAEIIAPSLVEPVLDVRRETVQFWLIEICTSPEWSSTRKRGRIIEMEMMWICIQNPNVWTNAILSALRKWQQQQRLNAILEENINGPVPITAHAAPPDSQTQKVSKEDLAELRAYQEVWLENTENSPEEQNGAGSPARAAGGWSKLAGEWTAKPFGTI